MPRVRPSGRLTNTGEVRRTGKAGRPRKIYVDRRGKRFTFNRSKRWRPKFNRLSPPPSNWKDTGYSFHGDFASQLAQCWVVRRCDRCHGVRWVCEQWRMMWTRPKADGTWLTRSRPVKVHDVLFPRRAARYPKPDITCSCLGKHGQPSARQVAAMAYRVAISRYRGKDGPPVYREEP